MNFRIKTISLFLFVGVLILVIGCEKLGPAAPDDDAVMNGPLADLTPSENSLFLEGADEFDEVYTSETGLGPIFVASSCASCHAGDNKGHLFTSLTRFGQSDTSGNKFLDLGGPQIQHNFITGYKGEVLPSGATSTNLVAPIVAGMGFLELVGENDLLSREDPNDVNGDGISGRVNWNTIPNWIKPSNNSITNGNKFICRFGKKASTYNLHQQTVQAFNQDMGVTSSFLPKNPINYNESGNSVPISDIEISDKSINHNVFYLQTLQAPPRRNIEVSAVKEGEKLFAQINCNSCHVEKLRTGTSPVAALSNKDFFPFTDLLLHDMGPNLDDHYTEGTAMTYEWRTAPLWGLGISKKSQGGQYFLMHDGRARSIEEAIEMHGGEANGAVTKYKKLSTEEKSSLIKFLESL